MTFMKVTGTLAVKLTLEASLIPVFVTVGVGLRLHRETRIAGDRGHVAVEDVGGVG